MDSLWKKAQERLSDADLKLFKFHRPDSERREILEDILKAVQAQSDRCLHKRWKIKGFNGKDIVLRDVCGKMFSWVNQFLTVIDVAAQYDPVHASLPWAGIRFFLQLSINDAKTFDAMIEGLEIISRVVTRYGLVEILYMKGTSDAQKQLREQLIVLYAAVLRYLCKARRFYSHNTAARMVVFALRPPELDEALKQIVDQEVVVRGHADLVDSERQATLAILATDTKAIAHGLDIVLQDVQAQLHKLDAPLVRTISQISALQIQRDEGQKRQVLSWLSRIPYRKHHEALSSDIIQGSGRWFVSSSKFLDWKASSSSQILWLNGPSGCGKTRLISATLNILRDEMSTTTNAAPLAFFYCSKASAEIERTDPCQVLRAITKQLSHPNGQAAILQFCVDAYEKKRVEAERDGLDPSSLTMAECVDLVLELTSTTSATIIIDALDECDSSKRYQLLEALERIIKDSRNVVKILISSQRACDIDAKLSLFDQMTISATETQHDLTTFIDAQVARVVRSGRLIPGQVVSQVLQQHIAGVLKSGAHGSFRWVSLQIESLCDSEKVKHEDDLYTTLDSLPQDLMASYQLTYERISNMQPASHVTAVTTLSWLLFAQRLLSAQELLAAVSNTLRGTKSGVNISHIVNSCCNLVIYDKVSEVFRLAHPTVQDYLQTLHYYDPGNTNLRIANTCLRVFTKGLSSTKDPIIDYATVYWAVHQERASGADSETRDLLSAFLFEEDHFDNWLDSLDSLQISTRLGYLNGDLIIRLQAARSTPTSPTFAVASFGLVEALETNRRDDWTVEWDKLNDEGAPPLYLAARWGHLDTVEYMIDRGADVNISGGRYDTALQVAAYFGHTKIVSMLLDNGAVAFGSGNGPFPNVVHAAIAGNCPSIAKHILDQGFEFPDQSSYDACYSIAAFSGQVSTVQLLLDIFAGKYTPQTVHDPLQVALYGRKERKAKALLAGYGDINQQIGYFGNALQAAICGGKLSLVETLTDYRADLGLRGRYGYPLRVAASFGHRDIVQWLLTEQNADPNVKDEELGDCLQAAAVNGHAEIVALLLQHGAKIEGSGGASRWQIKAASALGHLRIAQILFKNGAYIHQNEFLMAAILARQDDAVRFLIDKGAKVNFDSIQAKTSFTRVGFGEESNRVGSREEITHVSAFSALAALEPQENEEIEDNRETRWDPEIRRLPLPEIKELHDFDYDLFESGPLIAATLRRNLILVSLLLSAGARIDAGGENTFTALQAAAHYGYREIVDRLLDAGANPNRCCNVFGSALHAALDGSQFEIATLLLKRGANIHQHWYGFGSCLQIYSERGDLSVVRYLLDQGADINDRGGQNGTALQVAASTGRLEVVRFLVEHGAELNAPGGDLGTALQAAADTDHFEIAQYLSSQGARTTLSPALQIGVDCL